MFMKFFFFFVVACLKSRQHASVSQGRICSDNCTCCRAEIETGGCGGCGVWGGGGGALPLYQRGSMYVNITVA